MLSDYAIEAWTRAWAQVRDTGAGRHGPARCHGAAPAAMEAFHTVPHVPDIGGRGRAMAFPPIPDIAGVPARPPEGSEHFVELLHGKTVHVRVDQEDRCLDIRSEEYRTVPVIEGRVFEWRDTQSEITAGQGIITLEGTERVVFIGIDPFAPEIMAEQVGPAVLGDDGPEPVGLRRHIEGRDTALAVSVKDDPVRFRDASQDERIQAGPITWSRPAMGPSGVRMRSPGVARLA